VDSSTHGGSVAGARYGGLSIGEALPGRGELEVPLYRARDEAGESLVVAPLGPVPGAPVPTPAAERDAARDHTAALYDRALRLAHVEHPSLPKLQESMAPELPDPFLAWAVPEGRTVRALLDDHAPELARATRIALGVADALAALHAAGEVHGALCPANVQVDEDGTVHLLGVGVASTRVGAAVWPPGVARYRAPEQLGFVRGAIDPRSDVFSLGVLFYELVNGERAFPGDQLEELRRAMAAAPPTSVGYHFGGLGGALPAPLDQALRGALQPDPAARLRNVGELARHLRALLDLLEPGSAAALRVLPKAAEPMGPALPAPVRDRRRERARDDGPLPRALWVVPGLVLLVMILVAALVLWLR
jgi:hypothetical protein